jgi:hypothetical protein
LALLAVAVTEAFATSLMTSPPLRLRLYWPRRATPFNGQLSEFQLKRT